MKRHNIKYALLVTVILIFLIAPVLSVSILCVVYKTTSSATIILLIIVLIYILFLSLFLSFILGYESGYDAGKNNKN